MLKVSDRVNIKSTLLLTCLCFLQLGADLLPAFGAQSVGYQTILALQSEKSKERRAAKKAIIGSRDQSLIPGLIDSLFFTPEEFQEETVEALVALANIDVGPGYHDWVEWIGKHPEVDPLAGYVEFKSRLLSRIDSLYSKIFYFDVPMKIRFEEIVWGGVRVGGIPALVEPKVIAADEADYLSDDERVFGAAVNGAYRAYPLRIMDWHEMANDTLGGRPVTLSYCTLCGSGILYDTRKPGGGQFVFGTSGVLYRSNKLMIDEDTLSLWSNLTGEPVVGKLVPEPIRLQVLPMTLTTWKAWRTLHPDTTVLDLDSLQSRFAFLYDPGAAEESRRGVAFPVWQRDNRLSRNKEVYALVVRGRPKAYSTAAASAAGILNDTIGDTAVVLVADKDSGSIRVFLRGDRMFESGPGGQLVDDRGVGWTVTEEALISDSAEEQAERLERLPGHVAYWFGWYGFYPNTELWTGDDPAQGQPSSESGESTASTRR